MLDVDDLYNLTSSDLDRIRARKIWMNNSYNIIFIFCVCSANEWWFLTGICFSPPSPTARLSTKKSLSRKQASILVFYKWSISSGCARQLGTVPLVSHQPKQVQNINIVKINILIWYINIVYVTFIEGGTAVFPCMASAFGISYSPDCKQSLGSLHWTYATKKLYVHWNNKWQFTRSRNVLETEGCTKYIRNIFSSCLPPPHSLLWSSAHHNAEANGSYDPIKARRDPLLLSITTSIIPYDVDDYGSSYYM